MSDTALDDVIDVMQRLHAECPWNAIQTHETLAPYAVEEAAELVEAVESGDTDDIIEELGDLLYQVVFQAEVARANGEGWDIQTVAERLAAKMIERHPHVYGDAVATTPDDVVPLWQAAKAAQKARRAARDLPFPPPPVV